MAAELIPEGSGPIAVLAGALAAVALGLIELVKSYFRGRKGPAEVQLAPDLEKAIAAGLEVANETLRMVAQLSNLHNATDADGAPRIYTRQILYSRVEELHTLVKHQVLPALREIKKNGGSE